MATYRVDNDLFMSFTQLLRIKQGTWLVLNHKVREDGVRSTGTTALRHARTYNKPERTEAASARLELVGELGNNGARSSR